MSRELEPVDLQKELKDIKQRLEALEIRIFTISSKADELDRRTVGSIRLGPAR